MDESSRKFLVTGATGFVGGRLMQALVKAHGARSVTALVHTRGRASEEERLTRFRQQGIELLEYDLLALPQSKLHRPMFDVLYHLAGFTESENARGSFQVNSLGTRNLLEWLAQDLPSKRVIFTGTLASVDSDDAVHAVTESTVCTPKTVYGQTKLEGENCVKLYASKLNFPYTILRLCTIVGPGYRPGGMFNIFPKMLAEKALATRLNWPGRSSFLSLNDLIKILVALPDRPETSNETFVLDNGEGPTFDQALDTIATLLNLPRKRIRLPAWCWGMIGALAWNIAKVKITPYRLHNTCWRASHMIGNGPWADSSKITRLMGWKYESLAAALGEAYGVRGDE